MPRNPKARRAYIAAITKKKKAVEAPKGETVTLKTGEKVDKKLYDSLPKKAQAVLNDFGIKKFNSWVDLPVLEGGDYDLDKIFASPEMTALFLAVEPKGAKIQNDYNAWVAGGRLEYKEEEVGRAYDTRAYKPSLTRGLNQKEGTNYISEWATGDADDYILKYGRKAIEDAINITMEANGDHMRAVDLMVVKGYSQADAEILLEHANYYVKPIININEPDKILGWEFVSHEAGKHGEIASGDISQINESLYQGAGEIDPTTGEPIWGAEQTYTAPSEFETKTLKEFGSEIDPWEDPEYLKTLTEKVGAGNEMYYAYALQMAQMIDPSLTMDDLLKDNTLKETSYFMYSPEYAAKYQAMMSDPEKARKFNELVAQQGFLSDQMQGANSLLTALQNKRDAFYGLQPFTMDWTPTADDINKQLLFLDPKLSTFVNSDGSIDIVKAHDAGYDETLFRMGVTPQDIEKALAIKKLEGLTIKQALEQGLQAELRLLGVTDEEIWNVEATDYLEKNYAKPDGTIDVDKAIADGVPATYIYALYGGKDVEIVGSGNG